MHADETQVHMRGTRGYVWVFTSLEEVVYVYTDSREGDALRGALRRTFDASLDDFQGVLVSDFYAVYDSVHCLQQKCLIHLIRDLNDALFKDPFNEELKVLAGQFTDVLRPIIATIDRFGLTSRFLRKHKPAVERFYEELLVAGWESELAATWTKRFVKTRGTLFTFLDHDGIPWNNNNAENAIKAFVQLRRVFGSTQTPGSIQAYLVLLSISETCRFKGVDFLDFLRSGRKDIDAFIRATNG